jgi:hypothetical protein
MKISIKVVVASVHIIENEWHITGCLHKRRSNDEQNNGEEGHIHSLFCHV